MTENSTETTTVEAPVEYEKGSWGDLLQKSTALKERAGKANKQAGLFLWNGATAAIEEWSGTAAADPSGEGLYEDLLAALGKSRKGDASKIKTVALAVVNNGLVLGMHDNLSKAYAEAVRLTKTAVADKADDSTAESVLDSIDAPKTASSVEASAKMLLSRGIDGAVVAIFDAITEAAGGDADKAEAAIRAFLRGASTEAASRVKHRADEAKRVADEAKAAEREAREAEREAAKAEREAAKPKAAPKKASEKKAAPAAKQTAAPKAAKPVARPKPVAKKKAEAEAAAE